MREAIHSESTATQTTKVLDRRCRHHRGRHTSSDERRIVCFGAPLFGLLDLQPAGASKLLCTHPYSVAAPIRLIPVEPMAVRVQHWDMQLGVLLPSFLTKFHYLSVPVPFHPPLFSADILLHLKASTPSSTQPVVSLQIQQLRTSRFAFVAAKASRSSCRTRRTGNL